MVILLGFMPRFAKKSTKKRARLLIKATQTRGMKKGKPVMENPPNPRISHYNPISHREQGIVQTIGRFATFMGHHSNHWGAKGIGVRDHSYGNHEHMPRLVAPNGDDYPFAEPFACLTD